MKTNNLTKTKPKILKTFIIGIIFILLTTAISRADYWKTDLENAKEIARKNDNPIILVFQGSDWCIPCIKLNNNVWSSKIFKEYADNNFVMLKADFPQKKKNALSPEQKRKNEELAEKYNFPGNFPWVLILDKNGEVIATTGYKDVSPQEYIKHLESLIPTKNKIFTKPLKLMGSRFEITVVADDSARANSYINIAKHEIIRIDKLISSWDESSQTSTININAGLKPVKVSKELFDLIQRSLNISKITDGAFDISFAPLNDLWKFDGSMTKLPAEDEIEEALAKVNYKQIVLDEQDATVFLTQKGMKIGFGAIGKGYAADKAKKLLIETGVKAGIINASGDMNVWGKRPDGSEWKVAITNPLNKNNAFATLPIINGAVATSGDYEKFVTINDKRYSHIINPSTGYPAKGVLSVTVFAPKAEIADAFATSIFVMDIEVGLDRINQIPNVESVIVDDEGNIHTSKNINLNKK